MAVGIGKYPRSKTRGRRRGKYVVDATAAVDAVREGLHTPSTMLKIRGRRGILEVNTVNAVDAVFSQTRLKCDGTDGSTQLNSTQPDITDADVNTSISASMYPTFLKT